jgi:inhibitor of cysteine peptidase
MRLATIIYKEFRMNLKPVSKLNMVIYLVIITLLVACAISPEAQESANSESFEEESSTLAMVDAVTVEQRDNHYYAVINGFYPDACTYVSSVEQIVEDNTISITLLTDRPHDLICAAMLTPFNIDVLLTTGGLMPQEYNVVVNEGPSTTFSLE